MNKKKIGVAFLGCGNVAALHEQAIRQIEGVELIGLAGATAEESDRQAALWHTEGFSSFDALLDDSRVEVVFILTPVECHFQHAVAALEKGKHIIIEKPVGRNPAEIRELQRLAKARGLHCLPGHNYIYAPELRRAKGLLERGDLGTICGLWINFAIFHPEEMMRAWPGALRQVGTHLYYTLLFLAGTPHRLYASLSRLNNKEITQEDQFLIHAEMPGGANASIFCTFACDDVTSDPWNFYVKILGTKGGFSYSWRNAIFNRPLGTLPLAIVAYEESFREMDEYLLLRCIGKNQPPLSSLDDAITVAELIELSEDSAARHQPREVGGA